MLINLQRTLIPESGSHPQAPVKSLLSDHSLGRSMKSQCPRPAISILFRNKTVEVMLDSSSHGDVSSGSTVSSGYRQKHLPMEYTADQYKKDLTISAT